jgi:Holliday junction DNA helicase RuvA
MIGKLKGMVDTVAEDHALLDVGGVGYEVFCSAMTLRALPPSGGAATLLIATHVREDHIHLYGFGSHLEKEWFERLQSVQGVGARVALAILSVLAPDDVGRAIATGDKKSITQAAGVGGRLAERIVNELKDKVSKLSLGPAAGGMNGAPPAPGLLQDAVSALVHLGYREADIVPKVNAVIAASGESAALDLVIRDTLKSLLPQGRTR